MLRDFLLLLLLMSYSVSTSGAVQRSMPRLLLGTGSRGCSPSDACEAAVKDAANLGWPGIDCAWEYETQTEVARGIAASGVPRSEIYIQTKIPGPVGRAAALKYTDNNLAQLNVSTVDMLMMHYPCSEDFPQPRDGCSANEGATQRLETWRAMEEMVYAGKARALGVSNFRVEHLDALIREARVPVSANQVEWHLGFHDDALLTLCKQHNVTLQAYSPLGGGGTSTGRDGGISLDDPLVAKVALRHNASAAQVALRWSMQQGVTVVTSTVKDKWLRQDLSILEGPVLTGPELLALSALQAAVPAVRIVDDWPDVMLPLVGLGSAPDGAAILEWARVGGRHVVVGAGQQSEQGAAGGLRAVLAAGVASREEMFITATLSGPIGYAATLRWASSTPLLLAPSHSPLSRPPFIDLILLGSPCLDGTAACGGASGDRDAVLGTWKALVELRQKGTARSLGTANFRQEHLAWIVGAPASDGGLLRDDPTANASAVCANQAEFRIGYHDEALLAYCAGHNITVLASAAPAASPSLAPPIPDSNPLLRATAEAHNVSAEQVRQRYVLQRGVAAVIGVKEVAAAGGASLLKPLFNFVLTDREMAGLGAL